MSNGLLPRLLPLFAAMSLAALAGDATPAQGASFTVNATHDAVDAAPGDGICADAGGACTLRAAVMETNALPGADEISLPAGTYVYTYQIQATVAGDFRVMPAHAGEFYFPEVYGRSAGSTFTITGETASQP